MQILLIVPYFNKEGVGEDYSNYKFIEGLSRRYSVTVLTIARPGYESRLGGLSAKLVEFADSRLNLALVRRSGLYERFAREANPNYLLFYMKARRWILDHGHEFAIIHQFSPLALRYPTPALAFLERKSTTFIAGPLGGSLVTPRPLRKFPWLSGARVVDRLRFRFDPLLRATFSRADCLIGAAPYVQSHLACVSIRRLETMSEMGIDGPGAAPREWRPGEPFQLLFVGRLIPTKGVIQAIRCLTKLDDLPFLTLKIAGEGPLAEKCRTLIARLGLQERVTLLGRLQRSQVFKLYESSHLFLFPSYREPTGHVVYEAMSFGLPVVTTDNGGPAYIVTDESGFRVRPQRSPEFEESLAAAVRRLVADGNLRKSMGAAAQRRVLEAASWPKKIDLLQAIYESAMESKVAR